MNQQIPKSHRIQAALDCLYSMPPASTSLEAYMLLHHAINQVEDFYLGKESYDPPSTFRNGTKTDRIYITHPESIHPVPRYSGIQIFIHLKEILFISRFGAIELQRKMPDDPFGLILHFEERKDMVMWNKLDARGDGVWHSKNK